MKKSIYTLEQIDALLSGKGMAFLGRYDTVDDVESPVDGGHYYIGTETPYNVFTYINGAWVDAGPFQGPKGDPFRYEDFTQEQLDDLERGAKAAQFAAESAAENATQSAEQAFVSEQNAAGRASAAAQSASDANSAKEAAQASATAAAASAYSIGNAEQIVTQKAEEASASAENAAQSAEAAARSAEQANGPKSITLTLSASAWESTTMTQTVEVTGVSAIETTQLITPTPAMASQIAYYESGILCTLQAANSLRFTATTVPTEDLTVYVVIQEVGT